MVTKGLTRCSTAGHYRDPRRLTIVERDMTDSSSSFRTTAQHLPTRATEAVDEFSSLQQTIATGRRSPAGSDALRPSRHAERDPKPIAPWNKVARDERR